MTGDGITAMADELRMARAKEIVSRREDIESLGEMTGRSLRNRGLERTGSCSPRGSGFAGAGISRSVVSLANTSSRFWNLAVPHYLSLPSLGSSTASIRAILRGRPKRCGSSTRSFGTS